jgi:hypothetical protein
VKIERDGKFVSIRNVGRLWGAWPTSRRPSHKHAFDHQ